MLTLTSLTTLASVAAFSPYDVEPIPRVTSTFPEAETSVAANGRVVFFGGAFDAVLLLVRADGTVRELQEERFPIDGVRSALVVDLAGEELAVGESIRIEDRCDAGCDFVGTWLVDEPDVDPPVLEDGPSDIDVVAQRNAFGVTHSYRVSARLPGARDDRSAVVGAWASDEDDLTLFSPRAFADGAPIELSAIVSGPEPRRVCFNARAIDASGNEATLADALCVDVDDVDDDDGGCAQTNASSVALGALALALMRRRSVIR